MKKNLIAFFLIFTMFFQTSCEYFGFNKDKKSEKDSSNVEILESDTMGTELIAEDDPRVENLLKQMSLDEKIGQMTQICASTITLNGTKDLDLNVDKIRESILKHHVGSFLSGTGTAARWVKFITEIQNIAIKESRLKIPIVFGIDHVHGANYVDEGTMLPHNITLSCSFDTALAASAARVTAIETADLGMPWNFTPVLDIGKNPYWPRFYETFGEDPLVCGILGTTFIKQYENFKDISPYKLSACAKHFIGYSDPKSGYDRTPSEIPEQILYEQFLPPFKMSIDAGVKSVMINSGELNGEPVHGSKKLLDGLLRKKLGFNGVIITDIKDILKIVEMHKGAATEKEATLMAIEAGIDMYMACNSYDFCNIMKELVSEGKVTEERINQSVRRILKFKYDLNLFEAPLPSDKRLNLIGSKENHDEAVKAAEQSIVLLKNEKNLLPLTSKTKKILVAGFAADSKRLLNGAWTLEWLGAEEKRQPAKQLTIYQSLYKEFFDSEVTLGITDKLKSPKDEELFLQQCKQNDVIILTVGDTLYSEFKGNSNDILLLPSHRKMVDIAIQSGKPVVLVLIEGRPRIITDYASSVAAILFAGHPGQGGGEAIARIISGKVVPSGKLSFTYPLSVGHNVTYYHKASDKYTALYPFGHGLSYAKFEYKNLTLTDSILYNTGKSLVATIEVENTGNVDAQEIVLWYLQDEVGTITRPVKMLKHFEKRMIPKGTTQKFSFLIEPERDFSYPDADGNSIVEKGKFKIMVGNQERGIIYR